jgi:hypothetical protein
MGLSRFQPQPTPFRGLVPAPGRVTQMIQPWDAEWPDWTVEGGLNSQILVLGLAARAGSRGMAMVVPADLAEKVVEALSRSSRARFAFGQVVDLEDMAVATE